MSNKPSKLKGLTDGQLKAKKLMLDTRSTFVLKGYAGVGKSFLLRSYLQDLPRTTLVSVTAPTHKALSVINGISTIHSLLGLKLKEVYGDQVLVKASKPKVKFRQVVIIDEASMISTELLNYILEAQDEYYLTVIFIGDPAQIPPIGEESSPVWDLNCPSITLTEIVRQAEGSSIIGLATSIRQGDMNGFERFIDNRTVFGGDWGDLVKFYASCMDGSTIPPILSYRNATVNKANKWARDYVKDYPEEHFLVGEEVFIRSTDENQKHNLEDIVKILDITPEYQYDKAGVDLKWPLQVMDIKISSHKGTETLTIPATPRDLFIVDKNKDYLSWLARNKRDKTWKPFWAFSKSISEVKHIYALTCHRSQGSTFENVIVNCKDISDQRMMYTAVTRASDQLFLYDY